MNDIQAPTLIQRAKYLIVLPFLRLEWFKNRISCYKKILSFSEKAKSLELEIQRFKSKRDQLELSKPHNLETYHEMKGFCDGLDWVLKGDWK